MEDTRDSKWFYFEILTSAETGRRHGHSRSAAIEGNRSFGHFHHSLLLTNPGRHLDTCRGTRRGRAGRDCGDRDTVRHIVPVIPVADRIRHVAYVTTTSVAAVRSLASHVVGTAVTVTIDTVRGATVAGTTTADSRHTDHSLPGYVLNGTGRSRPDTSRLKDRVLFRGVRTGNRWQPTGWAFVARHRVLRHLVPRHVMNFLLGRFQLQQRDRGGMLVFGGGRDPCNRLGCRHRWPRPGSGVADERSGSWIRADRWNRRRGN